MPTQPESTTDDVLTIVYALPEILRALSSTRSRVSQGLTVPQVQALFRLATADRMTMGELAARMGVSCAAATQVIERLVDLGLAVRERPDWDRRVVLVRLTDQARPAMQQTIDRRTRQVQEVFDQLTPDEVGGFVKGIRALAQVLLRDLEATGATAHRAGRPEARA